MELFNGQSRSLKNKRRDLKRLIDEMHNSFNVAAAEMDGRNTYQPARLAVAVVSSDARRNSRVFERVIAGIRKDHLVRQLADCGIRKVY
jgi:uncharacterized protein YlxP (DUF503 family)